MSDLIALPIFTLTEDLFEVLCKGQDLIVTNSEGNEPLVVLRAAPSITAKFMELVREAIVDHAIKTAPEPWNPNDNKKKKKHKLKLM